MIFTAAKIQLFQVLIPLQNHDIKTVWGENDPKTNKGYGLKHIVEKHGESIKALGFNIEDFIPIVVQYGNLSSTKSNEEYLLESNMFRVVVEKMAFGGKKLWILTAFDLSKKTHTWKEQSLTLSAQCGLFLVGITKIVDAGSFTCLHCMAQQRCKNTKNLVLIPLQNHDIKTKRQSSDGSLRIQIQHGGERDSGGIVQIV